MSESFQQVVEKRLSKPDTRYGYPIVKASDEGLDNWFKKNPHVAGMAIGGGANNIDGQRRIVFNPYVRNQDGSEFSESQREALYKVEAMRHLGDEQAAAGKKIEFKITPEMQAWREKKFKNGEAYLTDDQAFKETIISRALVGDDNAPLSEEAMNFVQQYQALLEGQK